MIKILPKEKNGKICYGLTLEEFKCKCSVESCRATIISNDLIKAYKKFRHLIGKKMTISSGYRCPYHNQKIGGTALSRHTAGEAIDISKKSMNHLSDEEIDHAAKMSGFTFVKQYKAFVHLDVRKYKEIM